jgi:hypothetical protein
MLPRKFLKTLYHMFICVLHTGQVLCDLSQWSMQSLKEMCE